MKLAAWAAIVIATISATNIAYSATYITAGGGYLISSGAPSLTLNSSNARYAPNVAGTSIVNLPNVNWKNSFNNGAEGFLAAGANITPAVRLEGEFLYQSFQRNVSGTYTWRQVNTIGGDLFANQPGNPISNTHSTLNSYSLLANAYYDFDFQSRWKPFLGLGAGIGHLHASGTTANNSLLINDLTSGFAVIAPTVARTPALNGIVFVWQVKAGLSYAITPALSLVGQYRFFRTSSYNINSGSITTNPNTTVATTFSTLSKSVSGLIINSFDLGLTYQFAT